MPTPSLSHLAAAVFTGAALLAPWQTAAAQTPAPGQAVTTPSPSPDDGQADRHSQRIERIRIEDGGSRVDELRVGGETRRITVQPKVGDMPAYQIAPSRPGLDGGTTGHTGTQGRRTWNAIEF